MSGGIEVYAIVATLIASLAMSGVALYKAWRGSPQEDARAMQTYQSMLDKATIDLKLQRADIVLMQVENKALLIKINELEVEVVSYRNGVKRLIKQLEAHDIDPSWRP
jgi:hypothetical protein